MGDLHEVAAAVGLVIVQPVAQRPPPRLPTCWLWPQNVPLWNAWLQLQTQWRMAGLEVQRTGLDYAAVTAWLQAHGWHHGRQRSLRHALHCIAGMEAACLAVWAAQIQHNRQRARLNNTPPPPTP